MVINLYRRVLGTEGYTRGEFLGKITWVDNETKIEVEDTELKEKLEPLLSEPFEYIKGDPSGIKLVQILARAEPNTEEFFQVVPYKIRDELGLLTVLED